MNSVNRINFKQFISDVSWVILLHSKNPKDITCITDVLANNYKQLCSKVTKRNNSHFKNPRHSVLPSVELKSMKSNLDAVLTIALCTGYDNDMMLYRFLKKEYRNCLKNHIINSNNLQIKNSNNVQKLANNKLK